jgi:polyferredoxin
MKQIDFEHGKITDNILRASIPMLVAEVLSLLYNIVDRIYIARIPDVGTTALGAVGLCFPIITIILAIIIYRPFCRYICPLGAFYSAFNSVSVFRYSVDKDKCIHCGKCAKACPVDAIQCGIRRKPQTTATASEVRSVD